MSLLRYLSLCIVCFAFSSGAQELPYFITYSHHMEEPGSLEVETKSLAGQPEGGNPFLASATALEYGVRAWWTSELYLENQVTAHESAVFSGFRLENRLRPLMREHRVNPVLYFEFEDINGANKSLLEVVGHDGGQDLAGPNRETRAEKKREVELKLILSSNAKGWNFSENIIAEKNVRHAPWEFGYALAFSRPLRLESGTRDSALSLQNFAVGGEMYGGLGDRNSFGTRDTSHYFAPTVNWMLPRGATLLVSPTFGLNGNSVSHFYRFGVAYEISQVGRYFHRSREVR